MTPRRHCQPAAQAFEEGSGLSSDETVQRTYSFWIHSGMGAQEISGYSGKFIATVLNARANVLLEPPMRASLDPLEEFVSSP